MELILIEDVVSLGGIGDLVKVNPGYGRNYLLPQKKAVFATRKNKQSYEHKKRLAMKKLERVKIETASIVNKISNIEATFYRKIIEDDKLYGSVSLADIQVFLKEKNIFVERHQIKLKEPIKLLGSYEIPIVLGYNLVTNMKLIVTKEE